MIDPLNQYFSKHSNSKELWIFGPMPTDYKFLVKEPCLFIDGGTIHQDGFGLSIGDGDSSKDHLDIQLNKKKDYSDLAFALRNIPNHIKIIHLIGFLDGRKDHELANLLEAYSLVKQKSLTIYFENRIIISKGEYSLSHKGLFSLQLLEDSKVNLDGDIDYKYSDQWPAHSLFRCQQQS